MRSGQHVCYLDSGTACELSGTCDVGTLSRTESGRVERRPRIAWQLANLSLAAGSRVRCWSGAVRSGVGRAGRHHVTHQTVRVSGDASGVTNTGAGVRRPLPVPGAVRSGPVPFSYRGAIAHSFVIRPLRTVRTRTGGTGTMTGTRGPSAPPRRLDRTRRPSVRQT